MLLAHLPVTAATGLLCALLLTAQIVAVAAAGAQNAGPPPPAVPASTPMSSSLQLAQPLTNLTVDYMPSEYVLLTTDWLCNETMHCVGFAGRGA